MTLSSFLLFFYIKFVTSVSIFGNSATQRYITIKKNLLNGIRLSVVMHSNQTPAKEYSRQIRYTNIKGITV